MVIGCWFFVLGSLQAANKEPFSNGNRFAAGDTLSAQTFVSESEFSLFIAEELKITESITSLNMQEVDSLHKLLNETKKVLIPKADLVKFLGFKVTSPETKQVMGQAVELSPKNRTQRLTLDVIEGDSFTLNYVVEEGIGNAGKIEILLNQVSVAKAAAKKRGKKITLAFVASETGEVEIVLRNTGPLKEKGTIQVHVTPRAENVVVKKIRSVVLRKELVDAQVQDTLFQTVVDERVVLTHRANLKGNSVLQKQLDFGIDNEVLGFALFFFPYSEKDNLQVSRRETYREDPLEDFSVKELSGKSFTYLPEFAFPELSVSLIDTQRKIFWSNGNHPALEAWKVSPNSKANYAFFKTKQTLGNGSVQVKFSNTSDLYDLDFGLKIISLTLKKFTIKQEVDVEGFEETILLTLL
jgi:hypothetical protein